MLASLMVCDFFASSAIWVCSVLTDSSELSIQERLFDLRPLLIGAEGVHKWPLMAGLLRSMTGTAMRLTAVLDALAGVDWRVLIRKDQT